MILTRADYKIPVELLDKVSKFCGVAREAVIPAPTVKSIYDVPLNLEQYDIARVIGKQLGLTRRMPDMTEWEEGRKRYEAAIKPVRIALVGKYTHLDDAYLSQIESIKSAAVFHGYKAEIVWVDSEKLEKDDAEVWKDLKSAAGIVVSSGFGSRGIEGKIAAARYARTQKVPYLGLCLGSQILAIEFARSMLKDDQLTSQEFDEKGKLGQERYVVHYLPGQHKGRSMGGTLRLGAYQCRLKKGTQAYASYKASDQIAKDGTISERHRHRYEFNQSFRMRLEEKGLVFSGEWPETGLMEIVEVKDHPFMVGSQFHPEFKSRPHRPHPLFAGFMKAVIGK
jgi:CTP synthase